MNRFRLIALAAAVLTLTPVALASTSPTGSSATAAHVSACAAGRTQTARCRNHRKVLRWRHVTHPYWRTFVRIAQCESHRHWHTPTYGGLGFLPRSWRQFGGRGTAASASRLEQIYRAVLVRKRMGWNAWPVCRHHAGV